MYMATYLLFPYVKPKAGFACQLRIPRGFGGLASFCTLRFGPATDRRGDYGKRLPPVPLPQKGSRPLYCRGIVE